MTQEEMERFLNERQNRSEDALMEELKRMTREQEQAGEMSPTRMEEIYSTLSPFLSESQREKMREGIRRLKECTRRPCEPFVSFPFPPFTGAAFCGTLPY